MGLDRARALALDLAGIEVLDNRIVQRLQKVGRRSRGLIHGASVWTTMDALRSGEAKRRSIEWAASSCAELYDGSLVEIIQHGHERAGEAAADWLEATERSWDLKHLTALRRIVED